jgi:trehalose 6-phosphate synthase
VSCLDEKSPGALVLSTLAGAARELEAAVLVNPYDTEGMADGLQRALNMRLEERQERHRTMLDVLRRNDIHTWCRRFLEALHSTELRMT